MTRAGMVWALVGLISGLISGCGQSDQGGDTQTNWLSECTRSEQCGGLECLCGLCTKACDTSDCASMAKGAECFPATNQAVQSLCQSTTASALCLPGCESEAACGANQQCLEGACVPKPEVAVMTDDPGEFCQLWVDAFTAYMDGCGCGATATTRYREQGVAACAADDGFAGLGAALDRGDLRYDAAAARAMLARLAADTPLCVKEPFRDLRLDSVELYSFAGAFTGTHGLGQPCTMPVSYKGGTSDCAEGVCATDGTANAGVCVAWADVGDQCDASGDENLKASVPRLCHDVRLSDSDGEYESAFDDLSCAAPDGGGASVCLDSLADGMTCKSHAVCASGRCVEGADPLVRTCQPTVAAGAACSTSKDCATGACRFELSPSVCGALLPDGAPCRNDDAACESGSCNDSPNGGACGPVATGAVGSACVLDEDCTTGVCRSGSCFADICGEYLD